MAESNFFFSNFTLKPGQFLEMEAFIPKDCKRFAMDFGKDEKNLVLHFNPRFDYGGDKLKIILSVRKDGVWGTEKKESFFPFQEGSDTKVSFQFMPCEITIQMPQGKPISFPLSSPIEEILYVSMKNLQPKSIVLKKAPVLEERRVLAP